MRARTNAVRDNARARAPSRGPGMAWARDGAPTQERPTAKFAPRAPRAPRPALVTAPGPRAPPIQHLFCPCLDSTTAGAGRLQIQSRRARRRRGAVHPARLAARRRPGSRHGCARKPAICATVHCGWVVVERGGGGRLHCGNRGSAQSVNQSDIIEILVYSIYPSSPRRRYATMQGGTKEAKEKGGKRRRGRRFATMQGGTKEANSRGGKRRRNGGRLGSVFFSFMQRASFSAFFWLWILCAL